MEKTEQPSFSVAEKFVSLNGEGIRAGELAVFIRFQGCNLRCSFCDTQWANDKDTPTDSMTTQELVAYVQSTGIRNVTLTGGEPLLQPHIDELITALGALGYRVEIETNGSVSLNRFAALSFRPSFTMDYKLPISEMEQHMHTENFQLLHAKDTVKFVVGCHSDLERATQIIHDYALTARCNVYFSPVFDEIEPAEIADYMKNNKLNGVKLQLQLHKYIWNPNQRGV